MEDLSNKMPVEVLSYLFSFREETEAKDKDLASVSKIWNAATKESMKLLFQSYEKSAVLKPYTELAKQLQVVTPKDQGESQYQYLQRVKFVFHEIMVKARQMGYTEESPSIDNLSPAHLQDVINWMEARNLNVFASKIPEMNTFLDTIQDLPDLEKAKEIKTWMKANESDLKNITDLAITKCNLTALPKEIKYFTGLKKLNLNFNNLTTLPSEIGSLTNLKTLLLTYNKLETLPSEIRFLTKLTMLALSHNQLTTLPSEIGSLTNLSQLTVSDNQLTTLPSAIGSLTNLKTLQIAENQLTILPSEIGSLTQLDIFLVSANQLTTVPSEIGSLTKLTILDLSYNQIAHFPDTIANLTHRGKGSFRSF